ncbi:hypothetical protein SAMN05421688_1219 [Poseidonocella pacifica]|uniref:Uncharacterized protein n=1 Tax=Poseidonocella pacifica TaxID=871651 RepID=A0A1I0WBU6_9RHOB|nr:hypothetical protein [Poseidonocella pacifica]SFA85847.1 hypothetical protein SAMN05421688_1219 [Poseidonocella pacifica]
MYYDENGHQYVARDTPSLSIDWVVFAAAATGLLIGALSSFSGAAQLLDVAGMAISNMASN